MDENTFALNGQTFATKSAAITFFRQMLGRYEVGQSVIESDRLILIDLLARHRHAENLLSRPIVGFRIANGHMYGRGVRRFEIIREDGSSDSFSYLKCIAPPADPHFQDVVWAMRVEVIEQTRRFHYQAFQGRSTIPCGITGVSVRMEGSQVDHADPLSFRTLVAGFLQAQGLRVSEILVTAEGRLNNCSAKYMADRELAKKWQDYHQEFARLRVTSKVANLRQKKTKVDFSEMR